MRSECFFGILSHPDFTKSVTVGYGISPYRSSEMPESRTFTAGGDFHPAPRIVFDIIILRTEHLSIKICIIYSINCLYFVCIYVTINL